MVGAPQQTIADILKELPNLEKFPKSVKLHALYQEPEWEPPLYDISRMLCRLAAHGPQRT